MSELLSQHREFIEHLQQHPYDNAHKRRYAAWLRTVWGDTNQGELIELQAGDYTSDHDRRLDEAIHYRRIAALASTERDRIRQTLNIQLNRVVCAGGFLTEAQIPLRDFTAKADVLLKQAPLLQHVDFGMELTRGDIQDLANCAQLSHLRGITFSHCQRALSAPKEAGLTSLRTLTASPHLRPLERLMVWRSELTGEGAKILATHPAFADLERLHLITTDIGDKGLQALSETRFACLRTLSIERDSFTAKGVAALQSAAFIPHLRRLNLSYNTFDQRAVDQLCALPLHSLEQLRIDCLTCQPEGLRQILQSHLAKYLQDLVLLKKPGCPDFYDIEDVLPPHLLYLIDHTANPVSYTQSDSVTQSSLSTTFDPLRPFSIDTNGHSQNIDSAPRQFQPTSRKRQRFTQKPQEFRDEILLEADDPFFGS